MKTDKFEVKFMKYFVDGPLKGLTFDTTLGFNNLESAQQYAGFLIAHSEKPVFSADKAPYTCHVIRINVL